MPDTISPWIINLLAWTSVSLGCLLWANAIRWYFMDSGCVGFDMTTASAFDLKWSKGAWLLGLGSGLLAHSLAVGIMVGVGGFLSAMLVKPVLVRTATTWVSKSASTEEGAPPPSGFSALNEAERDAAARRSASPDGDA